MNVNEWLESLRKVDLNDLDMNNIGSWPTAVKAVAGALLVLVILLLGYNFHVSELGEQLDRQRSEEVSLKEQFAVKAHQAANLEAYTQQMTDMENSFGVLLRQLPSDTEVPGLLEDITRTGLDNGLEFEEMKLLPEVVQQFYIELPIQSTVTGSYHSLASFVRGVAGLPRIVTLHDFEVKPASADTHTKLRMNILAKTYRYNDKGLTK